LRKAVKQWPKDSAAWVVLGQVLEAQQKTDEAYGACSQPLATDSNYLPAYLCLADISAHSENWNKVLQLSNADPRVHFLLAQIYEAKGDRESEAAQLREYLKYASDPNDVAMVKRYLSELEKPTNNQIRCPLRGTASTPHAPNITLRHLAGCRAFTRHVNYFRLSGLGRSYNRGSLETPWVFAYSDWLFSG
jgi:predicted Zn-dependent protease